MIIIIQKNNKDNLPINNEGFFAYEGFSNLNCKIEFYSIEELFTKEIIFDIAVGTINFIKASLSLKNKTYPNEDCYPKNNYFNRKILIETVSLLKDKKFPLFIKSVREKLFYSRVYSDYETFLTYNKNYLIENNALVYVCEPITIRTEYRCYILNNEIISINYYSGNPTLFPDIEIIKEIKKELYKETKNKNFSFDIGINENYETFFLEYNNCLAIGNYGISSDAYVSLIFETWKHYNLID